MLSRESFRKVKIYQAKKIQQHRHHWLHSWQWSHLPFLFLAILAFVALVSFLCVGCWLPSALDLFPRQASGLKFHYMKHTGERPHRCKVCDRGFITNEALKRHSVVHTGERPYLCGICGNSFTQRGRIAPHNSIACWMPFAKLAKSCCLKKIQNEVSLLASHSLTNGKSWLSQQKRWTDTRFGYTRHHRENTCVRSATKRSWRNLRCADTCACTQVPVHSQLNTQHRSLSCQADDDSLKRWNVLFFVTFGKECLLVQENPSVFCLFIKSVLLEQKKLCLLQVKSRFRVNTVEEPFPSTTSVNYMSKQTKVSASRLKGEMFLCKCSCFSLQQNVMGSSVSRNFHWGQTMMLKIYWPNCLSLSSFFTVKNCCDFVSASRCFEAQCVVTLAADLAVQ